MNIKKINGLIFLATLSGITLADNPIESRLVQNFPPTTIVLSGTYLASYEFVNRIPMTMVKPFKIEKKAFPVGEFAFNDQCTGRRLNHLESCKVDIYLNPSSLGTKTIQLIETYGFDEVPLPQLMTQATTTTGNTNVVGVVTTALPSSLNVNSSAPWKFTFTNNGSSTATGITVSVAGSSYNTNCTATLGYQSPSNSCYVEGTYTATTTGSQTVSTLFSYTQGTSIALATTTMGSGAAGGLTCTPATAFAPETLINTSTPVTLLCTNHSGANITIDNHTINVPTEFTISSGGDNCTAQTLANNASCQLSGIYHSPSTPVNDVIVSLLVNYHTASTSGLSAQTSSTTDVVSQITNLRNIRLVNQCNFDVWWSMVGGAITNTPTCSSDNDCPTGSSCNTSANICYYNNYGPITGSYQLNKNGGSATTQIIQTNASTSSDEVLWKGLISASTQCSGTSCQNNDCQSNGGTTSCAVGVGFQQPATEAEFTFKWTASGNVDTYDISNVNGFSFPISMATNQASSGYSCGTAGNNQAVGELKACNYTNVTPPTNMYYWVSNTHTPCVGQNSCSNPNQICGLAFDNTSNNFVQNCGNFLGYWAANQICQTNPNFSSPFGDAFTCTQMLSSPFADNTYTLTQLLKCSPPVSDAPLFNSCYLSYSNSFSSSELEQCCGCTNWSGIATPSASCPSGQTDPQWITYVKPLIEWMKKACPTSYSYPYDDKASTFQCTASETTSYTITFCPGGDTGLPNGKTDGRESAS